MGRHLAERFDTKAWQARRDAHRRCRHSRDQGWPSVGRGNDNKFSLRIERTHVDIELLSRHQFDRVGRRSAFTSGRAGTDRTRCKSTRGARRWTGSSDSNGDISVVEVTDRDRPVTLIDAGRINGQCQVRLVRAGARQSQSCCGRHCNHHSPELSQPILPK